MTKSCSATHKFALKLLNGIGAVALTVALAGTANAASCDSNCLDNMMQQVLRQMVLHQPGDLRFAPGAVIVENAVRSDDQHGSWLNLEKIRSGQTFADPSTGQVAYYGAADTSYGLSALFIRLKVADGAIAEQEIFSKGGEPPAPAAPGATPAPKPDYSGLLEPDILYTAVVPPDRRENRAALIATVHTYLLGIGKHDGSIPSFSYRCDRYSAGSKFTDNPAVPASRGGGTCATALNGLKGQMPVNIRTPIVDEKLGIVVAFFIIPHGERKVQGSTNVAEVFKIVDGKIRSIEEFGGGGKYPPTSGFPDES